MDTITLRQARLWRLAAHRLTAPLKAGSREAQRQAARAAAGACGLANSPPGTWQAALHHRCPALSRADMTRMLEEEKTLTQAWSLRGMPVVFPTGEEAAFLGALRAAPGEEWIYTQGVGLALEALGMEFEKALELVSRAAEGLRGAPVESKAALDEALAAAPPLEGTEAEALCQRPPANDDYYLLYSDDDAYARVAQRVVERGAEQMVPSIMEETGLSREDAYLLFVHNVQGNLAVNRLLGWRRGPEFAHAQELLSAYSEGGMRAVSAPCTPIAN